MATLVHMAFFAPSIHTTTPNGLLGSGVSAVGNNNSPGRTEEHWRCSSSVSGSVVADASGSIPRSTIQLHIGAVGLGFSPCPCAGRIGNSRQISGGTLVGRRRFVRKSSRSRSSSSASKLHKQSHSSGRALEPLRAKLPSSHNQEEEREGNDGRGSSHTHDDPEFASLPHRERTSEAEEEEREGSGSSSSSSSTSEETATVPYALVTGLASIGFVETVYLTWARLSGASVSCSVDGGGCTDVLSSSYATVFGIPLSLVGMVAYGAVALLGGIRLWSKSSSSSWDWKEEEKWIRWLLLGSTTSMAAASAYFMYILFTKLEGASCPYCVGSAVLSTALLLSSLRGFTSRDVGPMVGVQLGAGASVVLALSIAFGDSSAAQDLDLPSVEPEVFTVSSDRQISLAKHLQSVGARMFGAFWCSHCYEQKQMFGREAMKYVDYVECYPDGYRKGVQIAKACDTANIQGFPTWIIKGQTLSGEQGLSDLARASGFDISSLK